MENFLMLYKLGPMNQHTRPGFHAFPAVALLSAPGLCDPFLNRGIIITCPINIRSLWPQVSSNRNASRIFTGVK